MKGLSIIEEMKYLGVGSEDGLGKREGVIK